MEANMLERREYQRTPVNAGIFAAVKRPRILSPWTSRFVRLGPIVDISYGGLAIHYIENTLRIRPFPAMSLMVSDGEVAFKNLTVRTVSDRVIAHLPKKGAIRRRAFQFGGMSDTQADQLKNFLHQFGI